MPITLPTCCDAERGSPYSRGGLPEHDWSGTRSRTRNWETWILGLDCRTSVLGWLWLQMPGSPLCKGAYGDTCILLAFGIVAPCAFLHKLWITQSSHVCPMTHVPFPSSLLLWLSLSISTSLGLSHLGKKEGGREDSPSSLLLQQLSPLLSFTSKLLRSHPHTLSQSPPSAAPPS